MASGAAFGILPTIDGFDVICEATGRAVDHRETAQSANGVAQTLNAAQRHGVLVEAWGTRHPYRKDRLV